jgi:hypothetical protein
MKFLITLLSSYNEFILYNSYKSIISQINHNLDYNILIVVNSLDNSYYNDVCKKFKNIIVEIVQTRSNGKPGMGHNSVLEIFKNRKYYDYLIPVDGDDFLYPNALQQLSKILIYNPTVVVGGNEDYISNFSDLYNSRSNDCYKLNNGYFLYTQPNISIKKTFTLYDKGTSFRLILLHKSIFNYNIDKFYCEKSSVFDDYLFYLNILNLYYTSQCNIYYITLKNIYFYYKAHISSACYLNSSTCNDDLDAMINNFPLLINLYNNKIMIKLPILYIIDPCNNIIDYKLINDNISFEKKDFVNSDTYKSNYKFAYDLSIDLYNSTLEFIKIKLSNLNKYDFKEKHKLYLILENYLLNNNKSNIILEYFLIICNNINYITPDIVNIVLDNYSFTYDENSYINEFNNKNYISCYLIIYKILQNIDYINKSHYYYYYVSISKFTNSSLVFNNNILEISYNKIEVYNHKQIIMLIDSMDIDYTLTSPFLKGLGGTQSAYIYLALELSEKFNVIILNKKKSNIIVRQNNIYIMKYENIDNMINIINNINPDYIIYNFVNIGEILRKTINTNTKTTKTTKLFMYEHLTIYSNFNIKINSNYKDYYDKLMFVSENQCNDYNDYLELNKTFILNNSLSPLFYYNNILNNYDESIINKKRLNIIYISNPQRGLECFKYIFPRLKNKYPNIVLDIYSSLELYDIEDNTFLKNLYNDLKSIKDVNYNKPVSQIELINKMNESLLFIYPTFIVESFCNCMIEAMSCGCYVLSTNLGALKSVAHPYGTFIDIDILDKKNHPYYESINNIYIDKIVEESSKVIDLYLNKSIKLDNYLKNQINYVKKKYKNNSEIFIENIN